MRQILMVSAVALCAAGTAGGAQASTIERACMSSDRQQASRALCGCIQRVADVTLSRQDQRVAASFFGDPHRAQEIRQSSRARDSHFWARYRAFGATAERYCN